MDTTDRSELELIMSPRKTKAGKLATDIAETSVEDLDAELVELGRRWKNLSMIRELRAKEEGITTPPPAPPGAGGGTLPPAEAKPLTRDAANAAKSVSLTIAGTIGGLAHSYQNHKDSPFQSCRYMTRTNYESLIKSIIENIGDKKLTDLRAPDIQRLHDGWREGGMAARAHSRMTMLRGLVNFGVQVLEDSECERLAVILHNMRIKVERPQSSRLTRDQVEAIVSKAHEMELHSIALAQAFQFDCGLQQKDVIGEWVPIGEQDAPSDVIAINLKLKWVRGIRWSEIDEDKILRHPPSRGGKMMPLRLSQAPLVLAEFALIEKRLGRLPSSGPVIVSDGPHGTDKPYRGFHFSRVWRRVADAANIPRTFKNMGSRARVGDRETPAARANGGEG